MDSLAHLINKATADPRDPNSHSTFSTQQQCHPSFLQASPPPPYSTARTDNVDADTDADSDVEDEDSLPISVTVNAAHNIQGNNNLIPTPAATLCEASRLCSTLTAALQRMNHSTAMSLNNDAASISPADNRKPIRLTLTLNCGITIKGDRNVVGAVCLKPRSQPGAVSLSSSTSAVARAGGDSAVLAGAKRKADEQSIGEPESKRSTGSQSEA